MPWHYMENTIVYAHTLIHKIYHIFLFIAQVLYAVILEHEMSLVFTQKPIF